MRLDFQRKGEVFGRDKGMEERVVGMKPLNCPQLNVDVPCPLAVNIMMTYFFCVTCLDIPNISILILVLKHE